MNSGIDFVLYLGPVGCSADDQCRDLYRRLNDNNRSRIKCMDFNEIVRSLGPTKKPAWLRGYPTLSSYESPPRVVEGSKVIQTLTEWVQQQNQAAQQQQQQSRQMSSAQSGRPTEQIETIAQSSTPGGGFGMYAMVVDDSTYVSQLQNKSASTGSAPTRGGKISQSDIERFNQSRR